MKKESKVVMAKELQVLNALDVAKTQWYHFTAIIIAGMGFFTDAYDIFCISLVTKLLGRIYYHVDGAGKPGTLPPNIAAAVNGVAFCGTLSGQLFFGWLGDKMGRKRVYGMTLMLMVICSIGSGLSFSHDAKAVISTLCFFRFWLGFGIGGDYPLSATIMSEYANKKLHAAVFAMQGFGILAGGIFAIIVSSAFNAKFDAPAYEINALASTVPQADYVWRIIVMVGALPAALTYYWRMKMPETARYTALVAKNAKQAASDMSKVLQVDLEVEEQKGEQLAEDRSNQFGLFTKKFLRRHGLHLLGTTSTWFLLDIAFYSQNLFQKDIFSAIGWIPKAETMNAIDEVYKIAKAQTLIALCSTVPGYWFTVALIDKMGRFAIQLMGFFFMTVFMFALAIPYNHWTHKDNRIGFVIIYALTFFFANFGPNATTFVVPAEIFPARLRSTCHGISAAAGKLGAIVGAFGFLYMSQNKEKEKADAGYPAGIGVRNSLLVLGVVNFFGIVFTFLVPESKGKSLEEISGENETNEGYNKQPTKSSGLFSSDFLRCHEFRLLGRTSTWFLPDIAFYNQNLSRKDIFSAIGWIPPAKTTEAIQENPDKAKVYARHHTDIVVQNLLIVPGVLNLLTLPFIFLVPESMGNL
uniref:Major facilitator superfamily (MFS) profile domain-containing protein n=1 Tax=Salix viminalis TaxID=40686 RepID=A0A6N2LF59_SALVM